MAVPDDLTDFIEDLNNGYRTYIISLENRDGVQGAQFTLKDKLNDLFLRRKNKKFKTKSVRTRDSGDGTKEVLVKTTAPKEEFQTIVKGVTCLNTVTYTIYDGTFEEVISQSIEEKERADRLELEKQSLEEKIKEFDGQKRHAENNFLDLTQKYHSLKEHASSFESISRPLADVERDQLESKIESLKEQVRKFEETSPNKDADNSIEEKEKLAKELAEVKFELSQRPTIKELHELKEQKTAFEDQYKKELTATKLTAEQEGKYKSKIVELEEVIKKVDSSLFSFFAKPISDLINDLSIRFVNVESSISNSGKEALDELEREFYKIKIEMLEIALFERRGENAQVYEEILKRIRNSDQLTKKDVETMKKVLSTSMLVVPMYLGEPSRNLIFGVNESKREVQTIQGQVLKLENVLNKAKIAEERISDVQKDLAKARVELRDYQKVKKDLETTRRRLKELEEKSISVSVDDTHSLEQISDLESKSGSEYKSNLGLESDSVFAEHLSDQSVRAFEELQKAQEEILMLDETIAKYTSIASPIDVLQLLLKQHTQENMDAANTYEQFVTGKDAQTFKEILEIKEKPFHIYVSQDIRSMGISVRNDEELTQRVSALTLQIMPFEESDAYLTGKEKYDAAQKNITKTKGAILALGNLEDEESEDADMKQAIAKLEERIESYQKIITDFETQEKNHSLWQERITQFLQKMSEYKIKYDEAQSFTIEPKTVHMGVVAGETDLAYTMNLLLPLGNAEMKNASLYWLVLEQILAKTAVLRPKNIVSEMPEALCISLEYGKDTIPEKEIRKHQERLVRELQNEFDRTLAGKLGYTLDVWSVNNYKKNPEFSKSISEESEVTIEHIVSHPADYSSDVSSILGSNGSNGDRTVETKSATEQSDVLPIVPMDITVQVAPAVLNLLNEIQDVVRSKSLNGRLSKKDILYYVQKMVKKPSSLREISEAIMKEENIPMDQYSPASSKISANLVYLIREGKVIKEGVNKQYKFSPIHKDEADSV